MKVIIEFDPEYDKDVNKLRDLLSSLRSIRIDSNLSVSAPVGQAPVTPVGQAPVTPVGQTPATPIGQAPVTPVGQAPVTPVGQAPATPVGQTPATPVGQTPATPVGQTPAAPGKIWTAQSINEEILIPLFRRIGEAAFQNEAISKRFQPILQVEFQATSLGSVSPERFGDVARRLQEIIARDFPEGYTYGA